MMGPGRIFNPLLLLMFRLLHAVLKEATPKDLWGLLGSDFRLLKEAIAQVAMTFFMRVGQ